MYKNEHGTLEIRARLCENCLDFVTERARNIYVFHGYQCSSDQISFLIPCSLSWKDGRIGSGPGTSRRHADAVIGHRLIGFGLDSFIAYTRLTLILNSAHTVRGVFCFCMTWSCHTDHMENACRGNLHMYEGNMLRNMLEVCPQISLSCPQRNSALFCMMLYTRSVTVALTSLRLNPDTKPNVTLTSAPSNERTSFIVIISVIIVIIIRGCHEFAIVQVWLGSTFFFELAEQKFNKSPTDMCVSINWKRPDAAWWSKGATSLTYWPPRFLARKRILETTGKLTL